MKIVAATPIVFVLLWFSQSSFNRHYGSSASFISFSVRKQKVADLLKSPAFSIIQM